MKKYLSVLVTVVAALGFMGQSAQAGKKKPVVVVTPAPVYWPWFAPWGVRDPALSASNTVVGAGSTALYFGLKEHHHHGWYNSGISSGAAYAISSIGCAAVSPIIGTIVTRRELTQREVLVSAANCFVPILGGMIVNAQFDMHPEWEAPPPRRRR
jgi:hypothetical protein